MKVTTKTSQSLVEFVQRCDIEDSPVWEYINGQAVQKPMPQGRHSKLQFKLCESINQAAEAAKIAYALPELRCTFGERSIVPDIAVIYWSRIPITADGEIADQFNACPDWAIEILSPNQSNTQVINNLEYCLTWGCQLAWLLEPSDRTIQVFQPQQEPRIYRGSDRLPILTGIPLELSPDLIFSWLKM
jgi:Uma2 family endonuclease